ncbi:hypothetical protein V5799_016496 [Amblyomma americanum]|uniref:Ig-like domain-containing protein n=1 Tax=Amblyomma americanum TaxID=6943 RepID=A0AAQ4F623_AMBAM
MFLAPIPTIQASEGDDIVLTCLIENLGSHKVSWYRAGSGELLSFDTRMLTSDARVRSEHSRASSWQLRVASVRLSDAGLYVCVVDSTPRMSQLGALEVRPLTAGNRHSTVPFSNAATWSNSSATRQLHRGRRKSKRRKYRFIQEQPEKKDELVSKDEPYFAEPIPSLTVAAGRNAALKCVVENLGNHTVAWLNVDKQTLLALHTHVIVQNERIRVSHAGHRVWQLEIREVRPDDTGYYMCQVNTRPMKNQVGYLNVVVAPYFVDSFGPRNLTARENSNVSFRCEASGNPEPKVTWRREDAQPFRIGDQKVTVYRGQELFFKRVSRSHMGAYLCLASNGVPPSISRRIFLEVTFTPMIWVPNQVVGAPLGANVVLECHTEAHPPSENFWFRSSHRLDTAAANITSATSNDPRSRQKKPKRHEAYITRTGLKVYMKLTIKNLRKEDYGTYHCMAQNALDKTEGKIQLHEIEAPLGKTEPSTEVSTTTSASGKSQGGSDWTHRKPASNTVTGVKSPDKTQGRWAVQHFQDGIHNKESSRGQKGGRPKGTASTIRSTWMVILVELVLLHMRCSQG